MQHEQPASQAEALTWIRGTLTGDAGLTPAAVDSAIEAIIAALADYQSNRELDDRVRDGRDRLAPWWQRMSKSLRELKRDLETNPLGPTPGRFAEELNGEVRTFRRAVDDFEWWMQQTFDPRRGRGRRSDWPRGDLELRVAFVLAERGVEITTALEGICAKVLYQVYAVIGVDSEPQWKIRELLDLYGREIENRTRNAKSLKERL